MRVLAFLRDLHGTESAFAFAFAGFLISKRNPMQYRIFGDTFVGISINGPRLAVEVVGDFGHGRGKICK